MFSEQLVTVWSAPNYCYRCGNVAAILELDENLNKNYKIFEAAPQVFLRNSILKRKRKERRRLQKLFQIISFKFKPMVKLIIYFIMRFIVIFA